MSEFDTGGTTQQGIMGQLQHSEMQQVDDSELLNHLATHNPDYEPFEEGLIREIIAPPFNPDATHVMAVVGPSFSGKSTFAKHLATRIRNYPEVKDWEARHGTELHVYHSAIGRTQQKLATRLGIIPVGEDGVVVRGSITADMNRATTDLMTNLHHAGAHYIDGPKLLIEDLVGVTAMYDTDFKTVLGEEKGSLRMLRKIVRNGGKLVVMETSHEPSMEEAERRAKILAADPREVKGILASDHIQDDGETAEDIIESTKTSGSIASYRQARRIILTVAEGLIESGQLAYFIGQGEDLLKMSMEQRERFFDENPQEWLSFMTSYNPLWVRRLSLVPDDDFREMVNNVYRFTNPPYPESVKTRHRFAKATINTEDALAYKAAQPKASEMLIKTVGNLGIQIPYFR